MRLLSWPTSLTNIIQKDASFRVEALYFSAPLVVSFLSDTQTDAGIPPSLEAPDKPALSVTRQVLVAPLEPHEPCLASGCVPRQSEKGTEKQAGGHCSELPQARVESAGARGLPVASQPHWAPSAAPLPHSAPLLWFPVFSLRHLGPLHPFPSQPMDKCTRVRLTQPGK